MPEWKCRQGLRQLVQLIEPFDRDGEAFFDIGFLPVLDEFLSQLIGWAEEGESEKLKQRAGRALAERLRFLAAQEQQWARTNAGFDSMLQEFGDKRGARAPLNHLSWLVSRYVRVIEHDRWVADVLLLSDFADALDYSAERKEWLAKLVALPGLDSSSAKQWGEVVYERMRMDASKIMASPHMQARTTYRGRQRKEQLLSKTDAARFFDFKEVILDAVCTLARKPRGSVPGVTRP